jgi:hypothetical protein
MSQMNLDISPGQVVWPRVIDRSGDQPHRPGRHRARTSASAGSRRLRARDSGVSLGECRGLAAPASNRAIELIATRHFRSCRHAPMLPAPPPPLRSRVNAWRYACWFESLLPQRVLPPPSASSAPPSRVNARWTRCAQRRRSPDTGVARETGHERHDPGSCAHPASDERQGASHPGAGRAGAAGRRRTRRLPGRRLSGAHGRRHRARLGDWHVDRRHKRRNHRGQRTGQAGGAPARILAGSGQGPSARPALADIDLRQFAGQHVDPGGRCPRLFHAQSQRDLGSDLPARRRQGRLLFDRTAQGYARTSGRLRAARPTACQAVKMRRRMAVASSIFFRPGATLSHSSRPK